MAEQALLTEFIGRHRQLLIVTGAGCSTASGIPAYRDRTGKWLARSPIKHHEFINDPGTRRRYWARSMLGWPSVQAAAANPLHQALARWQTNGRINLLITQNVDGLHRQAGSSRLVELHGRIDRVVCLQCGCYSEREGVQTRLEQLNSNLLQHWQGLAVTPRPDGDADVAEVHYNDLICPPCQYCGGVLMPDVVFFGGNVPRARVAQCEQAVAQADAMLVLGSSLMVYSSYRFCRLAARLNKPIAIVNQGVTRADDLAALKLELDCVEAVAAADRAMGAQSA